jgi:hypothetical protein
VPHLRPGNTILLTYGSGKYRPIFRCKGARVARSTANRKAHALAESILLFMRSSATYTSDPIQSQRPSSESRSTQPQDLRHLDETILKPKGNNTLRKWGGSLRR